MEDYIIDNQMNASSQDGGTVDNKADIDETNLYDDLDNTAIDISKHEVQQQLSNLHNITIEPIVKAKDADVESTQQQQQQQEQVVEEVVELISSDDDNNESKAKEEPKKSIVQESNNYDDVSYYAAGQHVVIVLRHPIRLYFWGKFFVKVLFGNVCVLGHTLMTNQNYDMYSPRGSGKLYFETLPSEEQFNPMSLFTILASTQLNAFNTEQVATSVQEHDVVLYLQNINSSLMNYIKFLNVNPKPFPIAQRTMPATEHTYNISLQTFFYKAEECLSGVNIGENWYDLAHHIFSTDDNAKILVCGGKGVGKSTFNRFLLNSQVQTLPVIYVDLDVGQPEFGLPGTVSASMIDEPVFGPAYTHTHTTFLHMKFIRHIDVMKNTALYLNTVKDLINTLRKEYDDYPWIINTMGFVKGFGDGLNIAVIKIAKPTFVIQFHDIDARNNFDCCMSPETVMHYKSQSLGITITDERIHFHHMLIVSETQGIKKTYDSKYNRDLKVISYFANIFVDNKFYLTDYRPKE